MPKQVDHEERRTEIADAVRRVAIDRGLAGVSFREVAGEAGMSVALVQHYFGTKERLLVGTLDRQSELLATTIGARLTEVADPLERVRVVARSFLGTDDEGRDAMIVYHAFAAAAVTDEHLRSAEAFANGFALADLLAAELAAARDAGDAPGVTDPAADALVLLTMVLGLSLAVLLDQVDAGDAEAAFDAHLRRFG